MNTSPLKSILFVESMLNNVLLPAPFEPIKHKQPLLKLKFIWSRALLVEFVYVLLRFETSIKSINSHESNTYDLFTNWLSIKSISNSELLFIFLLVLNILNVKS